MASAIWTATSTAARRLPPRPWVRPWASVLRAPLTAKCGTRAIGAREQQRGGGGNRDQIEERAGTGAVIEHLVNGCGFDGPDADGRLRDPPGESSCNSGERKAFQKNLPHDARLTGSESHSRGEFARAPHGSGEAEIGEIRARDQQNKAAAQSEP